MKHTPTRSPRNSTNARRRGAALVYLTGSFTVLVAFCSLGIDVARCQLAKSVLRHSAQAAALAAAAQLRSGYSNVQNAAVAAASTNKIEGVGVSIDPVNDVQLINWVGPGNYSVVASWNISRANAVQVFARRTTAKGNPMPLSFGAIVGVRTCDVQQSAIALLDTQTTTVSVPTTSDPWLAGEPTGTIGSVTDSGYQGPRVNSVHPWQHDIAGPTGGHLPSGQAYNSPVQAGITLIPGATIQLSSVTGQGSNDPTLAMYNADGTSSSGISGAYDWAATGSIPTEHGMSNVNAPHNALMGVFLTNALPDHSAYSSPAALDFTSQSSRDYTTLNPTLQQVFYSGTGKTSVGQHQQSIVVPPGATRLFLGTMDGHEWSNNVGGYTATITQSWLSVVQ